MLENYNLGPAIAITPAATSAYISVHMYRSAQSDVQFTYFLLDCRLGANFHSAVCVSGDAGDGIWLSAFFSVVPQRDYLLMEKYCAARRGQPIADLILLQQPSTLDRRIS